SEQEKRQGQPDMHHEREQKDEHKLNRFAKDNSQPGIQARVNRLELAGEDADGFAGSQRTDSKRTEPEGVVIDGSAQARGGFGGGWGSCQNHHRAQQSSQQREDDGDNEKANQVLETRLRAVPCPRIPACQPANETAIVLILTANEQTENAAFG